MFCTGEVLKLKCSKLPDIMIVGMEKCGTATLRKFLTVHPKIYTSEPAYITNCFNHNDTDPTEVMDFYKEKECTPPGILRLERISVSAKPDIVHQYLPNLKIIAIVKEPVERTMSQFLHFAAMNRQLPVGVTDFDKAIMEDEEIRSKVLFWSYYADRIKPWIIAYGRENVLILDGDMFVKDPVSELKKAENFIGLTSEIHQENFVFSEDKRFYCLNTEKHKCMNKGKGRPHPDMKDSTREFLRNILKPHNELFFEMIGEKFPWNQ